MAEVYPGGKGNVFREIINRIPPIRVYIDAFLGAGPVMKNMRPAALNIGIELNPTVLEKTASKIDPSASIEWDGNLRGGFDFLWLPEKKTIKAEGPNIYRFIHGDCVKWLASYPFKGDELIYFDPPYLMETRKSQRPRYEYEFTEDDHVNLLRLAKTLPCKVMISGYHSQLYSSMLQGWWRASYQAVTRGGSMATEYLWMNYPQPVELHDYQWVGDDYRERERIKKKMKRYLSKFEKMDQQERQAILWAMQEAGFTAPSLETAVRAFTTTFDDVDVEPVGSSTCYS